MVSFVNTVGGRWNWKVEQPLELLGKLRVSGPFSLLPELRVFARPLDSPCPAFPWTLEEHRQAALHDVSTDGPGRVLVEMDKLLQRGVSEVSAWWQVQERMQWARFKPTPLTKKDLEEAARVIKATGSFRREYLGEWTRDLEVAVRRWAKLEDSRKRRR